MKIIIRMKHKKLSRFNNLQLLYYIEHRYNEAKNLFLFIIIDHFCVIGPAFLIFQITNYKFRYSSIWFYLRDSNYDLRDNVAYGIINSLLQFNLFQSHFNILPGRSIKQSL